MATQSVHPFRSEQDKAEFEALYARRAAAWPVPSETMELDTPAGRTFVRVSGRASDPPLVLLSGMRGTSLIRIPNIAALSARYRVYALDSIIDVGRSVARRGISTPDDLALWLDEVLGVLVPEGPLNLMGMSYGGWLAGLYALRSRSDCGGWCCSPWRQRAPILVLVLRAGDKVGRVRGGPPRAQLFLVGEHEKIYSPRAAVRRLERVAPGVRAEIVPGAGHDLTFVQPGLVAARVLEFLAA